MTSNRDSQPNLHDTEGRYANCFQIGVNDLEVVLDFGQAYDEGGAGSFHTRIVTSPGHASELVRVLEEALRRDQPAKGVGRPFTIAEAGEDPNDAASGGSPQ